MGYLERGDSVGSRDRTTVGPPIGPESWWDVTGRPCPMSNYPVPSEYYSGTGIRGGPLSLGSSDDESSRVNSNSGLTESEVLFAIFRDGISKMSPEISRVH